MADYYRSSQPEGQYAQPSHLDSLHRSVTHNSRYSHASASTRSWVQTGQQHPPPPPVEEYEVEQSMSPVRTPRPLPQPHLRPHTLYTVNASDNLEEEDEEYMNIDPNVSGQYDFQTFGMAPSRGVFTSPEPLPIAQPRPKQRSFVGGFVHGLRKLPKRMMGYGVSNEKGRLFRRGTLGTEVSGTSAGMTAGNTLPLYRSNPSTPVGGPSNVQYVQDLQMAFAPNSPIPEVMRAPPSEDPIPQSLLSGAALRRATPTFHVTPPSDNVSHESYAQIYQSPQPQNVEVVYQDPVVTSNAERTTVMVYTESGDRRSMPIPEPAPAPTLQRVPSRTPRTSGTSGRVPSVKINPPPVPSPSQPPPAAEQGQDPEMVMSPATEHPLPTADYRKMPHFPGSPSRGTMITGTGTSWYGTSYASELTPVERFFKTLYNLPWVSHGRVTIDYRPAAGLEGKLKTKGLTKKPMASWYRRFSRSSRNAELDLLSEGTFRTTPRTSLGTSLMSSVPSPPRSHRTKQSVGSSSSRAHRSHNNRRRHRHRRRSMSTIEEPEREESPIVPAVYPYAYPAYPYTYPGYAAVPPNMQAPGMSPTSPAGMSNHIQMQQMAAMQQQMRMAAPVPLQGHSLTHQHHNQHRERGGNSGGGGGNNNRDQQQQQQQQQHTSGSKRSPRGPRTRSTRRPTYPNGYAPYQALAFPPPPPPPPIYVAQQSTPTGGHSTVEGTAPVQHQGHVLQQVYIPMQVVPGAYGAVADYQMHEMSIPSPPSSPTPRAGSAMPDV